jgi:hypothetical protein
MLAAAVVAELLEDEVVAARERLGDRVAMLTVDGTAVLCQPRGLDQVLRLDGRGYDAEPFRFSVVDGAGVPLPGAAWPPGLHHSQHPVLDVPFACVQGLYEYHLHPGHVTDPWDRHRHRLRLVQLLDHLLRRCGR